jgi:DNA-directed RNA polymerase subunit M/transcription elongation factor TFIIS
MRKVSASELLAIWENGTGQSLINRHLALLATACSIPFNEAAQFSIGERDIRLLLLREWHFGYQLINVATCPKCGEKVEWEMTTRQLHLQEPRAEPNLVFSLESQGYSLNYRLPNSADMMLLPQFSHSHDLIRHCITSINGQQDKLDLSELTDQVFQELDQQMAKSDPQANITFDLTCPACQHQWASFFDIMNYFWVEIDRWAKLTFHEIYLLARSFSWTEKEILSLSPLRRQTYLNMLRG